MPPPITIWAWTHLWALDLALNNPQYVFILLDLAQQPPFSILRLVNSLINLLIDWRSSTFSLLLEPLSVLHLFVILMPIKSKPLTIVFLKRNHLIF